MYVLNLEDNAFKQSAIEAAVKGAGPKDLRIDCVDNLEDGLKMIREHKESGDPYDLIITDMWYPEYSCGSDSKSGEKLIETVKNNGWNIPVILCSSQNYKYPGILGSVHYTENGDWEYEMAQLVKQLCRKNI